MFRSSCVVINNCSMLRFVTVDTEIKKIRPSDSHSLVAWLAQPPFCSKILDDVSLIICWQFE